MNRLSNNRTRRPRSQGIVFALAFLLFVPLSPAARVLFYQAENGSPDIEAACLENIQLADIHPPPRSLLIAGINGATSPEPLKTRAGRNIQAEPAATTNTPNRFFLRRRLS